MNAKVLSLILVAGLASTGCMQRYAEVPTATKFDTTEQHRLQAAQHWQLIATDITKKLKNNMHGKIRKADLIYVVTAQESKFSNAIKLDVIKELVNDGYRVHRTTNDIDNDTPPADATIIDIQTQMVEFSENRIQASRTGIPSLITAGLWVASIMEPTVAGGVTMAVASYDSYKWFGNKQISGATPRTEIIVDISASTKDEYLATSKEAYYVTDTDKALYEAVNMQMKKFRLIGEK